MESNPTSERGSFEIVELGAEQWSELKELRLRALKDAPRAFGQTYEEGAAQGESEWRARMKSGRYLCVREGGKLVGMLCIVRQKGEKVQHVVNIYSVYVAPEARGKGVGKALMQRAIQEATDGSTVKIRLAVAADNEPALALYESMGFQKIADYKKELNVDGEYIDEIGMERFLQ